MPVTLEKKQERIVRTLEGPLFVSAGAGSGKTFTLTQRVLYALAPGSKPREQWADPRVPEPFLDSIDQVLAITFTDKAATELKERIRAGLVEAGMPREAEKVDAAWISTIHGMCSRIIRAHALDLGVDPAFTVAGYADDLKRLAVEHVVRRVAAEEARAEAMADDAAGEGMVAPVAPARVELGEHAVERAGGDAALGCGAVPAGDAPAAAGHASARPAFAALLDAFALEGSGEGGTGLTSLLSILMAILSKASATVGGLTAFRQVEPAPSYVELYEAYRDIAAATSYANAEEASCAVAAIEAYLASSRDLPALRACYTSCGALSLTARGMGKDEKSAVRAVRAARPRFFAEAYLACRSDALAELMPLAREVAREYAALKRERAVLDNDDLLTLAYDALSRDPRVRAAFAGRFKMVMVDEFQDTAQQQVELVRLLCSPDCRELCCVGDAQQSIYRFRGADVSVFRTMKAEVEAGGRGVVCDLDRNFRSHAAILGFADAIFAGGEENPLGRDFLHLESCGEETRRGARALTPDDPEDETVGTSRCQAVLAFGGTADKRAEAKAAAIAERFRRLRDEEGFRPSDMVILMARLSQADVYAEAVRAAGMPCVVSGGTSVFRRAPEVGVVRALLNFLANPDDGEQGITPLITSPMLGLGATELLALSTCVNAETGIVDTRTITGEVLLEGAIMEDFGPLPLLERARAVLGAAVARVGRDPVSAIARDAVAASGWLARLEEGGAQERAVAANVLKALAIVEDVEEGRAFAPRLVARAFADHIDHVKESPAVLSGADEDAVRIMTVHASKGLEFPVVAVTECDSVRASADRFQCCDRAGEVVWSALPNRFEPASDGELLKDLPEPDEDDYERVPPRAAEAFAFMRREAGRLDYEEAARLLYVALTRAREVVVLALGARYATELVPGHATSLVGEVLARILPPSDELPGLPDLGADRLDLPGAHPGDWQLVLLEDLLYPGRKKPNIAFAAEDYPLFRVDDDGAVEAGEEPTSREVLLVEPARVEMIALPAASPARDSYSYTSLAAALHAPGEDRADAAVQVLEQDEAVAATDGCVAGGTRRSGHTDDAAGARDEAVARAHAADGSATGADADALAGDPTALGSAFHAAAQWLVETGAEAVPAARVDALARYWGVTPAQRARLDAALARWERAAVRTELRSWSQVRAELPFFALGDEARRADFGPYVEGAIDVLCTDPARPGEAFVLDYKTGGSADETPAELQEKHALQAEVYAGVLHRAGFERVSLAFVRVEIEDPDHPGEPQVVRYDL